MPLKVAIISEKLGTYPAQDTTKIALEALARGHKIWEVYPADISHAAGKLIAKTRAYTGGEANAPQAEERIDLADMDVIHFRPNPPVDMAYLTTLYLLETIKDKVLIINDPGAIIKFPEKIFPLQFPEFTPATLITRDIQEIRRFAEKHKKIILKPLYEFAGNGVKKISAKDFKEEYEFITHWLEEAKLPLIAQVFLPKVAAGDKKLFFLDGEIVGVFTRIPQKGSYLANTAKGGVIHKAIINAREEKFAQLLAPVLKQHGIYICSVDVIDDMVTEINITSSGGFSQMEELYGEKPQIKLWDIIESKI